jgi:hypothetical protein
MPNFKKADIIEFKAKLLEEPIICIVTKGGGSLVLSFYSEETKGFRKYIDVVPNADRMKISTYAKMPQKLKEKYDFEFKTLKKGASVEFKDNGTTYQGVVTKGGNKPSVVYENGTLEIKGHASLFTEIDDSKFEKDEPSVMDKWSVVSFKEHKELSDESTAFSAYIALNGKKIFCVKHDGCGGEMTTHSVDTYDKKISDLFDKDVLTWAKQFGMTWKPFCLDEEWVLWFAEEKPLKINAKQHFIAEKNYRN